MIAEAFAGLLLAGGQSRRMGADKALLTLNGQTLLARQAEKLRRAGAREVLLSGRDEAFAAEAGAEGLICVPDPIPGLGPLAGLAAGLGAARRPHCLVLPVDAPLIPPETLAALAEAHLAGRPDATLLAFRGRREPLIGAYRAELADCIGRLLARGERSVRALLGEIHVAEFPWEGPEALLVNCNGPDDFRRAAAAAEALEAPQIPQDFSHWQG